MRITRANYEVFFIDYFDGLLDNEEQEELMRFLEAHPDLKEEFEAFDGTVNITPDHSITFPGKEQLKTSAKSEDVPTIDNYADWFIAYHEGDLNDVQKQQLEEFLHKHPELKKEFDLYSKLNVTPDTGIHYPVKERLKKKTKRGKVVFLKYMSYAAAAILILAGLFWLIEGGTPDREEQFVTPLAHYELRKIENIKAPIEKFPERDKENAMIDIAAPLTTAELKIQEEVTKLSSLTGTNDLTLYASYNERIPRRYEHTSEYYYQSIQLDLEYIAAVSEYKEKSFVEKLAYRVKNRIAPEDDFYVTDPGFTPLSLLGIGSSSLDELALFERKSNPAKEKSKKRSRNYQIKSGLFEFSHKRTIKKEAVNEDSE